MRFVGQRRPQTRAETAALLARVHAHWEVHGFGLWAVERDDRLIGFAGVAYAAFIPELARRTELGWRLERASWGQGLATEAAVAARDDALGRLGLPELISIIDPGNVRSKRVAAKVGMVHAVHLRGLEIWRLRQERTRLP